MKYENIAINQLNPAFYNPRTAHKKELDGLKASLTKFGFVDPVIANKRNNNIVGGHLRVQAWQQLGNNTVPVIWVDLDDHDERKLNVVLNSQLISGSFDELKLAELLETFKYDDDYDKNIQIAEINALNAALAVIKWKKLFGFYHDLGKEHHAIYDINVNKLMNDEATS